MEAFLVCRVSTYNQRDGLSLDTQEKNLTKYCKDAGFKIHNVIKLVSSAYKKKLPFVPPSTKGKQ